LPVSSRLFPEVFIIDRIECDTKPVRVLDKTIAVNRVLTICAEYECCL